MKSCIILIFVLSYSVIHSQNWEMVIYSGWSNYQGDLAPEVKLLESHPYFSFLLKKNLNQYVSLGMSISQARISGDDGNFKYLGFRSLSFTTNITEIAYVYEFNFLPFAFGLDYKKFTPYVSTGIAFFKFNPYIYYAGGKYYFQKLDTEGKRSSGAKKHNYLLEQLSIPLGGGFKFRLSKSFNAGINLNYRYCFTDYLDDVSTTYPDKVLLGQKYGPVAVQLSDRSLQKVGTPGKQRGRPDLKDWYMFYGIFISYKIRNSVCSFQ
jgi:hypothetical protein